MIKEKVLPPWVTFPGFDAFDSFWKQGGDAWFCYIWNPFWKSMSKEDQATYLDTWNAPKSWRDFYSEEWQSFLYNDEFN